MIAFKNDDEKHAWDLYVAGLMACDNVTINNGLAHADELLAARREREPDPPIESNDARHLAKELMRHLPGDIMLKTLLKEMGHDV
jgi:hypothetical protein